MKFGDKIFEARRKLGLSRKELADRANLAPRTIAYYELEGKLPKQKATVEALARALHTDTETLLDDNARFVINAQEAYGEEGARQARRLVSEIKSLYAGGTLKEEDMDAMMLAIQDAYWIARKKSLRSPDGGSDAHDR
ncbi:MAG: helix-turn-helix transcriptional regulator [Clostridia bacterium]|nr:helix-turn-helix transcriptional regulator [Clostridia bacterium]